MTGRPSGSTRHAQKGLAPDLVAVLPPWVAARVLVALAWWVAPVLVADARPGATTVPLQQGLFAWDGAFYRAIAEQGYGALPAEAIRFFPGYPLAGRWLGALVGTELALLLVANLGALAGAVVVRRLVLHEGRSEAEADRAAAFVTLFPASFVLVWAYAEGAFLVVAAASFLAARRGRWGWVVAAAFAAGLVRPNGALLALPLAIEAVRTGRAGGLPSWVARAAAVLAAPAGVGTYLVWVRTTAGDAWLPLTVQDELRGDANPLVRIGRGLADLFGPERFGDGLHVPFVLASLAALVIVARRYPASYAAFAGAVLVVALAADNLNSFERYALNAFPLVLALAAVTTSVRAERLALAVTGAGLWAACTLAWMAVYVP
jgi:hypothetical protein